MTGELLRQSAFASGFDAGRARAEAEVQRLTAEVKELTVMLAGTTELNGRMFGVVEAARARLASCDRAWGELGLTTAEVDMTDPDGLWAALRRALDRLDAAEKARTATPEGPQSAPSSQPPQPEQAT